MENKISIEQHNKEIHENLKRWNEKPLLKTVYMDLFSKMLPFILDDKDSRTVEIGSGIGQIKEIIPDCITTDIFPNDRIDQVESIYDLSFTDNEISNMIMLHVFHHLRYPGTALYELHRVMKIGGRVIILDPYISVLGRLVYGPLHHEPIAMKDKINWDAPEEFLVADDSYYAAQGNASRIFWRNEFGAELKGWKRVAVKRYSTIPYILSGGYSKPQMSPAWALGVMKVMEKVCDTMPGLLGMCLLVVLEKVDE